MVPNWERIGLKSKEEGLAHVISFLKSQEKHFVTTGFGQTTIRLGNTLFVLGDKKLKPKKYGKVQKK